VHILNNRYGTSNLTTHNEEKYDNCVNLSRLCLLKDETTYNFNKIDVIIVEELQFFPDAFDVIVDWCDNHNKIVGKEDKFILVGDAVYKPEFLPLIKMFNGKKTLIRGNYDRQFSDVILYEYFEEIIAEGDGLEIDVDSLKCYATHYPTRAKEDVFNLTAHIHSCWRCQRNMLNVGGFVWHFKPVSFEEIKFIYNAVENFYDDDVWCSNNSINTKYDYRGKKGSYADKL